MNVTDAAAGMETPIGKSEFARRRGVSPGRVTQWITEGKINGAAIVGEGREARIVESIACDQLRQRLDIHQRLGNGLTTRLNFDAPPAAPAPAAPVPSAEVLPFKSPAQPASKPATEVDEVGDQIRREQLESLQRKNRREAAEEAAAAGRFTDAEGARQAMGRLASQMMVAFEGALPELAAAVAAKFELPQRDVLHLMRTAYRDVRAKQATAAKTDLAAMPAMTDVDIGEEETEPA